MKTKRQEKILELINEENIETQEELAARLNDAGFKVTQATVSRDIRELKMTKVTYGGNRQKYAVIPAKSGDMDISEKLIRVFKETVLSLDYARNIMVVKTLNGMGMAVGVTLDNMNNPEIVGTIAGDDTVFCAMKSTQSAVSFIEKLESIIRES